MLEILNFCFAFKIWLLTVHVYKIERFFGEKALKNGKAIEYQKSLALFWKQGRDEQLCKFELFPAIRSWDQFLRRNKEHRLRHSCSCNVPQCATGGTFLLVWRAESRTYDIERFWNLSIVRELIILFTLALQLSFFPLCCSTCVPALPVKGSQSRGIL